MKKIIMLFVLIISAVSVSAQDVIVKKDGNTVVSKVVEVSTTEIKYKKWSNQDGPTYTIPITDVHAINYANGEREDYSNAAKSQQSNTYQSQSHQNATYQNQFQQQSNAYNANNSWNNSNYNYPQNTYNGYTKEELLRSAKAWDRAGNILCGVLVAGGICTGLLFTDGGAAYWICAGGGIVSGLIVGVIFDGIGDRRRRAAARLTSSHLFQQDLNLNLGNTRLSAGLDLMNDRMTNSRTLGVGVNLNF